MLGSLIRALIVVLVLVGLGAFFLGYRWGDDGRVSGPAVDRPIGTTGAVETGRERAREVGADVGEKLAVGVDRAERAASDAALTAKIKSKMALDDHVRAIDVDVDTRGNVVTLSGRVESEAIKQRALTLARDTEGVASVVDRLTVAYR